VTIAVREILFPTDLSAASRGAFAHARLLAERLALYHAVEIPWQVYAREADQDEAVRARFAARARREMDEMAAGAAVAETLVDTTVCVPSAFVDAALLELARRRRSRRPGLPRARRRARPRLVRDHRPCPRVAGRSHRHGAPRPRRHRGAHPGSTAERVIRHGHLPVLVV
jgi:nucleotide-binding universal stress UspA family protein